MPKASLFRSAFQALAFPQAILAFGDGAARVYSLLMASATLGSRASTVPLATGADHECTRWVHGAPHLAHQMGHATGFVVGIGSGRQGPVATLDFGKQSGEARASWSCYMFGSGWAGWRVGPHCRRHTEPVDLPVVAISPGSGQSAAVANAIVKHVHREPSSGAAP